MDVYFDKPNLKSYVSSSANSAFADCNRMLINKFDIKFNFAKEDLAKKDGDEKDEYKDVRQWITIMNDGFKGTISWNEKHPTRPLKSNTHTLFTRKQLSSVYLIDDGRIQQIEEYGLLLFGRVGREVEVLSSLMIPDTDYGFVKQIPIKGMENWQDIRKYTSPCSDIILVDQYLFSFAELYEVNVCSLIKEICSQAKDAKVNIVIMTLPQCYDKRTKTSFEPDWESIKTRIKQLVEANTGKKPNVTFVLSSNLGEHDRTIFTNYKSIESGDTFNYFDSAWKVISSGRHLEIFSLADREFYANSMQFVSDMQTVIDNVKRLNTDNIKGDKKCNYLNFSD